MTATTQGRAPGLGLIELIAIVLGGMIGGGIFSILGVAVDEVGHAAPVAIGIGVSIAILAVRSYAQLAKYYEDEGATYSFFKRTYDHSHHAAAAIGWIVVFGYIATLALYAFTFASYLGSVFPGSPASARPLIAAAVLAILAVLNATNVERVGHVEDLMVYTKLAALVLLVAVLYLTGSSSDARPVFEPGTGPGSLFAVAALTFVAFEGFQLAIHGWSEARDPHRNVPIAMYTSVFVAGTIYVLMAEGALWALDEAQIIADKEYALAAGAQAVLGSLGHALVLAAALLATSSAISGTLFGASRLVAVIAQDGYFPASLATRVRGHIPARAISTLAVLAWTLTLSGGLELILEFSSLTFIVVSCLMAAANLKLHAETETSRWSCVLALTVLAGAGVVILVRQAITHPVHLIVTVLLGAALGVAATLYAGHAIVAGEAGQVAE